MILTVEPCIVRTAKKLVATWHRKHPSLGGAMWAIQLLQEGEISGVAAIGRPKARMLQDGARRLELTRCAVTSGVPNGCSKLYAAAARAAQAMGAWDLFTYTSVSEPGTSLKASGWIRECTPDGTPIVFGGGSWSRRSRLRKRDRGDGPRHRWWARWSRYLESRGE